MCCYIYSLANCYIYTPLTQLPGVVTAGIYAMGAIDLSTHYIKLLHTNLCNKVYIQVSMYMWGHVQGASQWKARLQDRVAIPQHHVPFAGGVLPICSSLLPKSDNSVGGLWPRLLLKPKESHSLENHLGGSHACAGYYKLCMMVDS